MEINTKLEKQKNLYQTTRKSLSHLDLCQRNRNLNNDSLRKKRRGQLIEGKRILMYNTVDQIELSEANIIKVISDAISYLTSDKVERIEEGLTSIRFYLSSESITIERLIEIGLLDGLLHCLSVLNPQILTHALWCLTIVSTGSNEETRLLLNIVPSLAVLFKQHSSLNYSIPEQISCIVGNMACESDEFRHVLITMDWINILSEYITISVRNLSMITNQDHDSSADFTIRSSAQTAAWALSNLSRGTPSPIHFLNSACLRDIVQMVYYPPDIQVSSEICWYMVFLTAKSELDENGFTHLAQLGLIQQLSCAILSADHSHVPLMLPILRCLANLISGPSFILEMVCQNDSIINTLVLLTNRAYLVHRTIRKEAVQVVTTLLNTDDPYNKRILQATSSNLEALKASIKSADEVSNSSQSNKPAMSCELLNNLVDCYLSEEFDLQNESLRALNRIFRLDPVRLFSLLTVNEVVHKVMTVSVELLRRIVDVEVIFGVLQLIQSILEILSIPRSSLFPNLQQNALTALNYAIYHGLCDVLDELQYNPSLNDVLHGIITQFLDQLYNMMDEEGHLSY